MSEVTKLIMEIIARLDNEYKLTRKEIAEKIGETEFSFYKYARGIFPQNKPEKLEHMLKELQKLEKMEIQTKKFKPYPIIEGFSTVGEMENDLVIIYFPYNFKTESYSGDVRKAGATTDHNGSAGIIAYPNNSFQFEDADGLVPMNDPGADSIIPCGRLIAIKKIETRHCRSGYRYYFFDHAKQPYLRKLQVQDDKALRLISDNPGKFSDIILEPEEIAAAFRVLAVSYKSYE